MELSALGGFGVGFFGFAEIERVDKRQHPRQETSPSQACLTQPVGSGGSLAAGVLDSRPPSALVLLPSRALPSAVAGLVIVDPFWPSQRCLPQAEAGHAR